MIPEIFNRIILNVMPFKKVGKNKYKSPSGKTMTLSQVRAYYSKKSKNK